MTDKQICQDIAAHGCALYCCSGSQLLRVKSDRPCPLGIDGKECGYPSMDDVKSAANDWLEKHKEGL